MLNLKKGLALVLAAATAFTFAPVANLGNAVAAKAASEEQGENLTANYKSGQTTDVDTEFALTPGTYAVEFSKKSGTANPDNKNLKITITNAKAASGYDIANGITKDGQIVYTESNYSAGKLKVTIAKGQNADDNGSFTVTLYKISSTTSYTTTPSSAATESVKRSATKISTLTVNVTGVAKPTVKGLTGSTRKFPEKIYSNDYYHIYRGQEINLGRLTAQNDASPAADITIPSGAKVEWQVTTKNGYVGVSDQTLSSGQKSGDNVKLGKVKLTGLSVGTDKVTVKLVATDNITSGTTYTSAAKAFSKGDTIAEKTFDFVVDDNSKNIDSFTWVSANGKTSYLYDGTAFFKPAGIKDENLNDAATGSSEITLDPLVLKTQQIDVHATGALTYVSSDSKVFTVSQTGLVTAVAPGTARLTVYAAPAGSFTDVDSQSVLIKVTASSHDVISAKVGSDNADETTGYQLDLDPTTQTSGAAVHSAKINATSAAGLTINYQLVKGKEGADATAFGDSAIASVASDGTVTAGTKTGTVYVRLTTADNDKIKGADPVFVKVVVNALPQADISIADVRLDLTNNKTAELKPTSSIADAKFGYILDDSAKDIVDLKGSVVTAKKLGYGKITVTATATAKTRYTKKDINVAVVDNAAKTDSDLKVADSALTVKVGDTASAGASTTASGAAITYTSSDTDVATVAADGTITAVAPGTAVVTVKAAETDTVNAGTATIVVTVPSNPQKVTGVKVSNKKGAYVTVKWTSQGSNVNYRVYKKVGNGKWVGKNVAGNKATLSVKKGAKVQVKVKSYVKDASGKTTWGPTATKAKTFKTDKK